MENKHIEPGFVNASTCQKPRSYMAWVQFIIHFIDQRPISAVCSMLTSHTPLPAFVPIYVRASFMKYRDFFAERNMAAAYHILGYGEINTYTKKNYLRTLCEQSKINRFYLSQYVIKLVYD